MRETACTVTAQRLTDAMATVPTPPSSAIKNASRKVSLVAGVQKVGGEQIDPVAKDRRGSRRLRTSKVEPYRGSSSDALDALGGLADAAKIHQMDEQLKNKPCYIIDPMSTSMNVWDCVTALALVFTAIVTPFEVGLLESADTPLDVLFITNRVLDCAAAV